MKICPICKKEIHPPNRTTCGDSICKKKYKQSYDKSRRLKTKLCKECSITFTPSAKLKNYCSEKCSKKSDRDRNNKSTLEHYYRNKPIKYCKECNNDISDRKNASYCIECAKERRKVKNRNYNKNRNPENERRNREKSNAKRKKLRQQRIQDGLCSECTSKAIKGLTKCDRCHKEHNNRSVKYNRSQGIQEAGASRHENKVSNIFSEITKHKIQERVWGIVRNPRTNQSLQLDFYLPHIQLAIEVDGPMHREPVYGSERLEMQQRNDKIKDKECYNLGIYLLRINTDDMDNNSDEWLRTTLSQAIRMAESRVEGATHR